MTTTSKREEALRKAIAFNETDISDAELLDNISKDDRVTSSLDALYLIRELLEKELTTPPPAEKSAALSDTELTLSFEIMKLIEHKDNLPPAPYKPSEMHEWMTQKTQALERFWTFATNRKSPVRAALSHAPEVVTVTLDRLLHLADSDFNHRYGEDISKEDITICYDFIMRKFPNGLKISAPGGKEKS